ncbi:MAG: ZIP family metal transporter, partial [Sphaerochaetaceae bacterium]|nr:ZIP family metal transporter [Sphaerochaetaceae bacterium]
MTISLFITLIASLSTVLGLVIIEKLQNKNKFESISLAFATGLILMVSLGEMVPEAFEAIGLLKTAIALGIGVVLSLLLDVIFPHEHDEVQEPGHYIDECLCSHEESVSWGMILALVLHNVIEGFATGIALTSNLKIGFAMAIGIALHNLPIGFTLGITMESAGFKKGKIYLFVVLVALSQPLGAIGGLLLLALSKEVEILLGFSMAVASGIMVFVAFDELWPAARKSGR